VPEGAASPPPPVLHERTPSLLGGGESDVCEICERPGHDIFSCDLLRESSSPTLMMSRITADSPAKAPAPAKALHCVDCDSDGHVADECPYALDVF
jgi:CAP-Gly domain-containing linker protein 1